MTDQRELTGMDPDPPEQQVGTAHWTSREETLRVYDELYTVAFNGQMKSLPRKLDGDARSKEAHQLAAAETPKAECRKNLTPCMRITSYVVWTKESFSFGQGWAELAGKKYFPILICHACSGWEDGYMSGLYHTSTREQDEERINSAPMTAPEGKIYFDAWDKGHAKGKEKRQKFTEEKGADRYRTVRGKK